MVSQRLPPLNALRAFEATARHLSVKNAADELYVTPSAVSQMLKTLELHLGVVLFQRVNRGIFLTDAGQDYLPPVRNAFRQIAEATKRVAASVDTGILTVSVTPFFAAAWLVPRLKEFQDAQPDIDLQVVTSNTPADFSRDGVDVAVRHGLGRYPGLCSERVVAVEIVPVAAATLAAKLGTPASPAALTRWPHVHDADRKGWHLWFQAHGIDDIGIPRGPAFDDSSLLLKAVLAGQGAGLLPAAMVALDLAEGRLVKLADVALLEAFAYYLVYPEVSRERPKVAAFRTWILDAATRDASGEEAVSGAQQTKEGNAMKAKAVTIYGIKNCDTMKKARAWLDDRGVAYEFHDYKTAGIERGQIEAWAREAGWETLLNRAGTTFRKLPEKDREGLTEKKAIALMVSQPSMIKRPVLDAGGRLLVGFKPEQYETAFGTRR
jgi:LysR family glycine cleavage system transcriptional activator